MAYANIEAKRAYENRRNHERRKKVPPISVVKFNSNKVQLLLCKWGKQ